MPPTAPPVTASDGTQLDPTAAALTRSIRQVETGGNYSASGGSGEKGAYQWMPGNYENMAKEAGLDPSDFSPVNQDKVAYSRISKLLGAGYTQSQVASMWNSGSPEYEGKVGTNKYGVQYDVPAYVNKVKDAYLQNVGGGSTGNNVPQIQGATPTVATGHPPETPSGIVTPEPKPHGDLLDTAEHIVTSIFPGKKIGEAIGTLGGYLLSNHKENYDLSAPTPLQVAGDAAQAALTVGAGMPEATAGLKVFGKTVPVLKSAGTVLGRVGQTAAVGAGIGATGALAKGETDPGAVLRQSAVGGLVGGVLGGATEAVGAGTNALANKIMRSNVQGTNEEVAKYAVSKGMSTPKRMLADSEKTINEVGSQLGATLRQDQYKGITIEGNDVFERVQNQFPDAALSPEELQSRLNSIVPLKKALISKLFDETGEGLTLPELQSLNSALGKNTFKSVFDDPTVKAGKELGSSVYHAIGDAIKSVAPETEPMYKTLSLEYPLNKALQKAIRNGDKSKIITLLDLMAFTGSSAAGGPVAGLAGAAAMRVLRSREASMGAVGALNGLAKPGVQKVLAPTVMRQPAQSL